MSSMELDKCWVNTFWTNESQLLLHAQSRGWGGEGVGNAMSPRQNRWVRSATKCHLAGDANLMWSQVWLSYCDICTSAMNTNVKILHKMLANDFFSKFTKTGKHFLKKSQEKGPEISINREYHLGFWKTGWELSVFVLFCILWIINSKVFDSVIKM